MDSPASRRREMGSGAAGPPFDPGGPEFCVTSDPMRRIESIPWLVDSVYTTEQEATMPMHLVEQDVVREVAAFKSALIVPCRFCPAASTAVRSGEPYIEPLRGVLKTASYERLLEGLQHELEGRGVKVSVFKSRSPHHFVLCTWSSRRRRKLFERARRHEAVVVMGCEAAVESVRESVKSTGCHVVQGMRSDGVMSVRPRFSPPCNLWLELEGVTPMLHRERSANGNCIH